MPKRSKPSSKRSRLAKPNVAPVDQAKAWWGDHARVHKYVVSPTESPSAVVSKVLRQEGLIMEVAGRRAWILVPRTPENRRDVFLANYWPVVSLILTRYAPAVVGGLEAVKLYLGDFSPPETLPVYHGANQSEYMLPLE